MTDQPGPQESSAHPVPVPRGGAIAAGDEVVPARDRPCTPLMPGHRRGTGACAHPSRTLSTRPGVAPGAGWRRTPFASAPTPGTADPETRTDRSTCNGRIRGHTDRDDVLCNMRTADEWTQRSPLPDVPVQQKASQSKTAKRNTKTADPGAVRSHYTEG
jgi:hypothetical protein